MIRRGYGGSRQGRSTHCGVRPNQLYACLLVPIALMIFSVSLSSLMVPVGTTCQFGNDTGCRPLGRIVLRYSSGMEVIPYVLIQISAKKRIIGPQCGYDGDVSGGNAFSKR